ncbi:hypothetical protein [Streptomyces sp. enrichment culture]|uniref:hypothetical protein n=1 Tax=Streptomyces sp. enrichment culture TaxID=1795815 RepID=UPI003F57E436
MTKTAYEDPATRWGYRRTALFRLGFFLFSIGLLVGWLCVNVVFLTPVWLWVTFPLFLVLLYVWLVALGQLLNVRRLRRILRVYPWQSSHGTAQIAKNGTTQLTFQDPERPEKQISLKTGDWLGGKYSFWVRAVKAGAVDEVWFAGDPRFLGVIATPGPRRLVPLAQPEAVNDRASARKRGVSPEARERARAAGARVG